MKQAILRSTIPLLFVWFGLVVSANAAPPEEARVQEMCSNDFFEKAAGSGLAGMDMPRLPEAVEPSATFGHSDRSS